MQKDLVLANQDINNYLKSSEIIDFESPEIQDIADDLTQGNFDEVAIAKKAFEFVRDNIAHSADINGDVVTYKASEVLKHRQGICYAKSHLLAAILRRLGIPTGFCYQKLLLDDKGKRRLIIHGLNAVFLKSINKWIRVDARGNKEGVNAEFCLDKEKLAFPIRRELGEEDILVIYATPNSNVLDALKSSQNVAELINNLPSDL